MTDLRAFESALRALHEAATPGPWHVDVSGIWSNRGSCLGYIEEDGATITQDQQSEELVTFLRNAAPAIADMAGLLADARDALCEREAGWPLWRERTRDLIRRVDALEMT